MIEVAFAVSIALFALLLFAAWFIVQEQGGTIRDMKEANKRLFADNGRLMEALVRKEGGFLSRIPLEPTDVGLQTVRVKDGPPLRFEDQQPRASSAYFGSKESS